MVKSYMSLNFWLISDSFSCLEHEWSDGVGELGINDRYEILSVNVLSARKKY